MGSASKRLPRSKRESFFLEFSKRMETNVCVRMSFPRAVERHMLSRTDAEGNISESHPAGLRLISSKILWSEVTGRATETRVCSLYYFGEKDHLEYSSQARTDTCLNSCLYFL